MNDVLLVGRREFFERLRDRAFLISNGLIILVLVAATVIPALINDEPGALRVGTLGAEAEQLVQAAQAQSGPFQIEIEVQALPDRATGEAALRAGDLDAVAVGANEIVVESTVPAELETLLASAAANLSLTAALAQAGVPSEDVAALAAPPDLAVESLTEPEEFDFGPAFGIGFVGMMALYGLLILYGQWVAQGVVEEKASRVVEVLLATVRPTHLLAGKILGLGALGLLQIVVLAAVGVGTLLVTGLFEIPQEAYGTIALVLAWFVLGYALYATLFAVAGSIVSRVEDLQGTMAPVWMLIVGALLIAQFTAFTPEAPASRIAGLVPFTAPLLQPLRAAVGASAAWEVVAAIVLTLLTIAALVPLAGRLYSGGVLQTRRKIGLGEAWRAG